jgi:hypothetical protein
MILFYVSSCIPFDRKYIILNLKAATYADKIIAISEQTKLILLVFR